MIIRPENYQRISDGHGDPLTQTDATVDDYANVQYTYHDSGSPAYLIDEVTERGYGCSGCGMGVQGTTSFTWTVASLPNNYNSVYIHMVAVLPSARKCSPTIIDAAAY